MHTMRIFAIASLLLLSFLLLLPDHAMAAKKCYDCHTEAKQLFTSYKFVHQPTAQENCESCHKRHGFSQKLILTDNTNELCYSCHEEYRGRYETGNVHFPVSDGVCWDCHDPHGSNKKDFLRTGPEGANDPNSCLICHKTDLEDAIAGSVPHQPFQQQDCVVCHDPHNSGFTALLVSSPNELCGSCHDASGSKLQNAHAGMNAEALACTDCHSGHSSNNENLLSQRTHAPFGSGDCETCHSQPDESGNVTFEEGMGPNQSCAFCHDDIIAKTELSHPHPAVSADNCTDCHDPHSSQNRALLVSREGELCAQCHDGMLTEGGLTPHLPALLGDCTGCHDVHGSENTALAKATDSKLCLDCHEEFAAGLDTATTVHAAIDECTLCHQPHEGQTASLLRADPSTLCRDCHEPDQEALMATSGHQPYLTANCIGCHQPHYSNTAHLVRGGGPSMCLTCHPDVERYTTMTYPHPPATEDCQTCHAPHYSKDAPSLLVAHEGELCETCHDYDALNLNAEYVHTPASDGDCGGCHNPHGANQEHLVSGRVQKINVNGQMVGQLPRLGDKTSDLCYLCHDDLVEKFRQEGTHQPVAYGECDACHSAHGSDHRAFTTAGAPEMCLTCHTADDALSASHGGYNIANADCLNCHNPHVSGNPKLVRDHIHPPFEDPDGCGMCHETGAEGQAQLVVDEVELCGMCHESVADSPDDEHQHVPFVMGECGSCHGVHASDYEGMLRYEGSDLCFTCHEAVKESEELPVSHKPFREGQCLECHSPHSSPTAGLLTKPKEQFCFSCHEDLKKEIDQGQPHAPVIGGDCTACHEPHAGETANLLVETKDNLCGTCHDLNDPALTKAHNGFDVAGTDCQNCHVAHASQPDRAGLLLPEDHAPFAMGECDACHDGKQAGQFNAPVKDLCLTCHDSVEPDLSRKVVHFPVTQDDGCVGCHGPHVGFGTGIQKKDGVETCLNCHDGPEFTGSVKHAAAFEDCETCHQPHSSDYAHLLDTPDIMELCMTCHDDAQETHYHPMGGETIDPRTQQPLVCTGCHSPHSSNNEMILVADRDRKLCIMCHNVAH